MAFEPITGENLRVGLHIKIEGSWLSHPFPTNTLKIRTSKELQALLELQQVKLLYDPELSDPEGEVKEEDTPGLQSESVDDKPTSEKDPIQYKRDLLSSHQVYQEELRKVEEDYKKTLHCGKAMLQDLTVGSARGLSTAMELIASLNNILVGNEASRAKMHLMGSNQTGDDFLLHALNVTTLSILMAQDLGFKKHEIEKIALGAMFHDFGELKYTGEMLLKKSIPSDAETKEILKRHPKYGKEMLASFPNFPYECLDIVEQHHERLDGTGYPARIKERGITQYTKIVMVADEYDELCNQSNPTKCFTPSEALSYLYTKKQGKLWNEAISTLIRRIGVYPPGSFVKLSDGAIGLVISVAMETQLRPLVMVYSEDIPKEEAIILDLTQGKDLSIQKAIRPADLTLQMAGYLNLRRVISYHPSVSDTEQLVSQVGSKSELAQETVPREA